MVEDKDFFAWLDGELPADDAKRVEAEVAADPELSRLAAQHRAMVVRLRDTFSTVSDGPQPLPLQHASGLAGRSGVISLADKRSERRRRRELPLWSQMAALAATLVLGIFAGNMLTGPVFTGSEPVQEQDGHLVASAKLEEALQTQLASTPAKGSVRIGLTFRDRAGTICRTFEDRSVSGYACHEGGDWRLRSLFQGAGEGATDYRMASGPSPELMDAVEADLAGEPFDEAQERRARDRGWQ